MQRIDNEAALVECIQDVAQAERDADAGAPIELAEAVESRVERQPADHPDRMRICKWRAVAMEIRQHVQTTCEVEPFGLPQFPDARGNLLMHRRVGFPARCMPTDQVVEQRARC